MVQTLPPNLEILRHVCEKFGYEFMLIDEFSGCLAEVSDGKSSFLAGSIKLTPFPLNLATPNRVCGDKAFTKVLLQKKGFSVARGDYFFVRDDLAELRPSGKEFDDAVEFANRFGYPVFVKPNARALGILCEVVEDEASLKSHLVDIAESGSHIAIIEEVLKGDEYRIFVLDSEVEFCYRRNPLEGKKVANIAQGGSIQDYTEEVSPGVKDWIEKLSDAFGLRVFGVDFFASDIENPDTFTILEMNGNPSLGGIWELGKKEKVYEIWGKIFTEYFGGCPEDHA